MGPTQTKLTEKLYARVKENFDGGVQYDTTVKLDLEARKIIGRTKDKPKKYKLANAIR